MTVCGTQYNAPLRPGEARTYIWLCELTKGHPGLHASPSASISQTHASRLFGLRAVIASIPCDDCGRTDGTHDPEVEH